MNNVHNESVTLFRRWRPLEIHQLKYALAVAKNRSFVRAAYELCITPPALSQQVKKLEKELGVTIFERTTRSINLTPAGKEFIHYAQDTIASIYKINASMNKYVGAESGVISLGIFPAIGPFGLIGVIGAFQKTYPDITLDLHEAECIDLQDMLERGIIDAAFSTYTAAANENKHDMQIEELPLVHDELVLVTSSNHPFASRKIIDLIEAKDEDFIMQDPSSGAYVDMMTACKTVGFEPKVKFHAMSNLTRFGLVAEGLGISSASYTVAVSYLIHDITCVRFRPHIPRTLNLVLPLKDKLSPALENFKSFCIQWAEARKTMLL